MSFSDEYGGLYQEPSVSEVKQSRLMCLIDELNKGPLGVAPDEKSWRGKHPGLYTGYYEAYKVNADKDMDPGSNEHRLERTLARLVRKEQAVHPKFVEHYCSLELQIWVRDRILLVEEQEQEQRETLCSKRDNLILSILADIETQMFKATVLEEDPNLTSWDDKVGVLLNYNDAQEIVNFIKAK